MSNPSFLKTYWGILPFVAVSIFMCVAIVSRCGYPTTDAVGGPLVVCFSHDFDDYRSSIETAIDEINVSTGCRVFKTGVDVCNVSIVAGETSDQGHAAETWAALGSDGHAVIRVAYPGDITSWATPPGSPTTHGSTRSPTVLMFR
jgi:hypothetical protein